MGDRRGKQVNSYQQDLRGHELVRLVAAGMTLNAACRKLDIPWNSGMRAFRNQMAATADDRTKQEVLQTELETLSMMQQPMMAKALRGDSEAARTVLRIMERRAKMLGLDQALQVEIRLKEMDEAVKTIAMIVEGESEEVPALRRVDALAEGA